MKSLGTILSILALIGVIILGVLHFKGNNNSKKNRVVTTAAGAASKASNIAYVDIDTLQAYAKEFKAKKAEFEGEYEKITQEGERELQGLQNEFINLQKRVQEGKVGEAEYKVNVESLQKKQNNLEVKKQNYGTEFMKRQEKFNKKFKEEIKGFLETFAENNNYDFVFANSSMDLMLYSNTAFDITQDVVEALNSGKSYAKKDADKDKVETKELKINVDSTKK